MATLNDVMGLLSLANAAVDKAATRIASLPQPTPPVDLQPVADAVTSLTSRIDTLAVPADVPVSAPSA